MADGSKESGAGRENGRTSHRGNARARAEKTTATMPSAAFPAIGEHGIIGNMRTAALVGLRAQIDFMCYPAFDSPTIFASLLDPERGGSFTLTPDLPGAHVQQIYVPDTNVLLTRFMSDDGVAEITDFFPLRQSGEDDGNQLIRIVRVTRGVIRFALRCAPRFDYARARHQTHARSPSCIVFEPDVEPDAEPDTDADVETSGTRHANGRDSPGGSRHAQPPLVLHASVPLQTYRGETAADRGLVDATAQFTLTAHEDAQATFVLGTAPEPPPLDARGGDAALATTLAYWRVWSARSTYRGRYREKVNRSALLLKLLSSREHGAIIAAATFGLPETTDGERRWDYRYVWIRDAAFSVYALLRLGHTEEAGAFVEWINQRTQDEAFDGRIKLMYAVDGTCPAEEIAVPSLADGHAAQPPLIGNAAATQLQFDIYGALMDAIYLNNKYGNTSSYQGWQNIVKTVDYVAEHWREPDAGIWEFRDAQRELLHSRLMCWVTVDRALRLASKRSLPAPFARWSGVRSEIYQDIFDHFWNDDLQAFVQSKGSDRLDAAALMMPLVKFIAPKDPRWLSTLDAIGKQLVDDPLVYRYPVDGGDGLDGHEGSFIACSFWYAEALIRAGRVDEGQLFFEKILGYANHLGLYSEEISASGEPLGNFPQGLSHLALISTAYMLDRTLDKDRAPWSG